MKWEELLGLTVLGATVTTIGTIIGLVLKERFFVRSFEQWKAKLSVEQVARKYQEPIALAAIELCNRLSDICDDFPSKFLDSSILGTSVPHRPTLNSDADPYFNRYRLMSSVYRLCAFLGWIELYRQETTYLYVDPYESASASQAASAIFEVRADLADGQLNKATDWESWHDALIFREEQRAVGECMIVTVGQTRAIMGYAEFADLFPGGGKSSRERWFERAAAFLLDLQPEKDFRQVRMQRLVVHLVNLVELIAPHRLRPEHQESRARYMSNQW